MKAFFENMPSRKVKILQILPQLNRGGVEKGTVDLSEFLTKQGLKSFVCSSGGLCEQVLKDHGAEHVTLPVHSKNPFVIRQNSRELVDLIHHLNIDLVHVRSRAPAWSAFFACKKTNIPFVTTFHGTYNFNNPFKKYYNSVMVRGDRVIAISNFIQKHILQHYKRYLKDPKLVSVIHRGVDPNYFNPERISSAQIEALKKNLGILDTSRIVLLPGRLTRWKGQTVLIDAMKCLKDFNIVALIAGDDQGRTSYSSDLRKKIKSFGLTNKVKLIDNSYEMPLLYSLADVVVHTSTDPEAFGRVIAEAQSMGKPVVTNDLGAPKEIIIRNETGWLVPSKEPKKLADKIQFVLNLPPPQISEIQSKARSHVIQYFSKEQMCSKILDVYNELLEK